MKYRDYYAVLGVDKDADAQRIKQAYRRLARRHHPDLNPGDRGSAERFKDIGEAYTVLSDPEKKRRYDQLGANWGQHQQDFAARAARAGGARSGGARSAGFADFSSFFEQLFGPDSPFGPMPGAASGASGPQARVHHFSSGGNWPGSNWPGSAGAYPPEATPYAAEVTISLEEAFAGALREIRTASDRRFRVRIPAGIEDGTRVRAHTPEGDAILTIRIAPHARFARDGDNLEVEVPVDFAEAVFGGEVEIPTLDGSTRIRLPAGVSGGAAFRVRGKGMPRIAGGRGDLVARIQIVVPKDLTPEQKDVLRRFRGSASADD